MKRYVMPAPTWLVGKKTRLRALEAADVPFFRRCRLTIDPQAWGLVVQTLDGRDIGVLGVLVDGPHAAVAIGFVDDVSYGDGSAADALAVICGGLPRAMPIQRIEALVAVAASKSVDAHRKAGFQQEGVLREALFDGKAFRDAVIMSVLLDG